VLRAGERRLGMVGESAVVRPYMSLSAKGSAVIVARRLETNLKSWPSNSSAVYFGLDSPYFHYSRVFGHKLVEAPLVCNRK
jgi:hypothetical protein